MGDSVLLYTVAECISLGGLFNGRYSGGCAVSVSVNRSLKNTGKSLRTLGLEPGTMSADGVCSDVSTDQC